MIKVNERFPACRRPEGTSRRSGRPERKAELRQQLAQQEQRQPDDIQIPIDSMTLFDIDHAGQVLDFADEMRGKGAKRIILSCEMGQCRSAAVGLGIAEALGRRATWFDRRFELNAHTRGTVAEAARLRRGAKFEAALCELAAQA